jgi:glycosyltransferase 2 family protein
MTARLGWALRLGFSAVLLAALFHLLDEGAIAAALTGADPMWFALALAALWGQILLSALRWDLTARALGLEIGRGRAVSEYHLSVLGNTLLPGGVLGDMGRIARARHGGGLRLAAGSVILERLAGQVALAIAGALGLALWFWPAPWALAAATGIASLCVALVCGWLPLPGTLREGLLRAWGAAGVWPAQIGLSALILGCNLLGVWASAAAVGVVLPPAAALFVIPLTLLAMLLPLSVNGWGLREGVAAALWPLAGIAPALAVAASLAFGLAALAAVLAGSAAVGLATLWSRRPAARRRPGG